MIRGECKECGRNGVLNGDWICLKCWNKQRSYFNIDDLKNAIMDKPTMYKNLSGKTVKCIYVENEGIGLLSIQDLKDNKIYIIDNINIK
jgi:hypothetical protein